MSVNFTARLVNTTTVQHKVSWRNYIDSTVSIVELDKNNPKDMYALYCTANDWAEFGGQYSGNIYKNAIQQCNQADITKEHYLALTTQTADFHNLKHDYILGLMQFSETTNPENEIAFLEVSPITSKSKNFVREYQKVGTRLVEYAKEALNQKDIFVQSARDAVKFYRKNGFEQLGKYGSNKYKLYFRV